MTNPDPETSLILHASCVCWRERGILLEGASGSGKSQLALRLLDAGAVLVADDMVALRPGAGQGLLASAVRLAGHIEVRGQGIYRVASAGETSLDLAVQLAGQDPDRLPEPAMRRLLDRELPSITIGPDRSAAVARIGIALHGTRIA
jgi:serine kinase of HPr protein (carbohydrate metabolism regulator)